NSSAARPCRPAKSECCESQGSSRSACSICSMQRGRRQRRRVAPDYRNRDRLLFRRERKRKMDQGRAGRGIGQQENDLPSLRLNQATDANSLCEIPTFSYKSAVDLLGALKTHFGYDDFRPLQREIVRDALAGRDVFVLMPTGGGKSLCFQLPALMREGLTIVVSPLISLMKDQVDALQTGGIAATYLNSTLDRREATARWRGLHRGEYRMLYVGPERLMLDAFLERALNWNIAQFAIDEAHCISEWGHDFRPEYRELKKLRKHLPEVPIMALTATATERVRTDIV